MNRSGYVDDFGEDGGMTLGLYRAVVAKSLKGKRGQAFLRELADAMDAMEDKVLIVNELINSEGDCCTIGVICKSRGLDVSKIDPHEPDEVGNAVGISRSMAAEIEFENDQDFWHTNETPQQRWMRMRKWVDKQLGIVPTKEE